MSAYAWRVCPRCQAQATAERKRQQQTAERVYGQMPQAEYAALCREASKPIHLPERLRENREIYVTPDGTLHISYYCSCDTCGFTHSYEYHEKIDLGLKEPTDG